MMFIRVYLKIEDASVVTEVGAPAGVKKVEEDIEVHALKGKLPWAGGGDDEPATGTLEWGVDRIEADLVWDANGDLAADDGANTGSGVKTAIIDTGIDKDHPDLIDNIKGGTNFVAKRRKLNHDACDAAYDAGIVVVAAAGNSGDTDPDDDVIYPAKYDSVIAVAATDDDDNRASFSSDGVWDPIEVRSNLRATVDDLGTSGFDNYYGYGLVDAEESVTGTQTN